VEDKEKKIADTGCWIAEWRISEGTRNSPCGAASPLGKAEAFWGMADGKELMADIRCWMADGKSSVVSRLSSVAKRKMVDRN